MIFSIHDPSVGITLAEETRVYLRKQWTNFDVFIYMEEDVVVEYGHLIGYLAETQKLYDLIGREEALSKYMIGFQRYRRYLVPVEKNKQPMTEEGIIDRQEYLEEIPFFKPVCLGNRNDGMSSGGGGNVGDNARANKASATAVFGSNTNTILRSSKTTSATTSTTRTTGTRSTTGLPYLHVQGAGAPPALRMCSRRCGYLQGSRLQCYRSSANF